MGKISTFTVTGGGIINSGTLTLMNSTVSGNHIAAFGLVATGTGGGIANSGTLTVTRSTISGNRASGSAGDSGEGLGGGIANSGGTLTVTNSTISGNTASAAAHWEQAAALRGGWDLDQRHADRDEQHDRRQ